MTRKGMGIALPTSFAPAPQRERWSVGIRLITSTEQEIKAASIDLEKAHGSLLTWTSVAHVGRRGAWLRYGVLRMKG